MWNGPTCRPAPSWCQTLAQQVRDRAFGWTLDDAPAWALPYLPDMELVADLAVWRAAHAVPDTDLRPAGPRPLRLALRTWHQQFVDRAVHIAGDPTHGADRWKQLLVQEHRLDVAEDDWFPVLAARLTLADSAGIDVPALLSGVIDGQQPLPAQVPAKALWWRLEPRLGSLTADHILPASGHRLRPTWTTDLVEAFGELDAERIMSDRLWPTIVTHVDRALRDGQTATVILPAAAGMFAAARPTVGQHEMATVLLWQISTVTNPAPDPELEAAYPDPAERDLLAPTGAHELLDATQSATTRITTRSAPPIDLVTPAADPFDVDRYAAAAALIDAVYAGVDVSALLDLAEPDEQEIDAEPADDLPPTDLPTPEPVREWVTPEPPAIPVPTVEPDVAPVILRTAEQEAALARARAAITAAQTFWAEQTPNSWVPAYITGRGLDPADFLYAPAGWTRTMNHLKRQGFTEDELKAAGLITLSVRGTYVDLFQDRAVTGINDPDTGEVVAFTGRKNPDSSNERAPKYVNSPTTDLFTKSELPFGLTVDNIQALRAGADLAIVEGPMDALAVNQAFTGDRAVVALAASGVAFTADHIATINRIAPNPDRRWLLVLDEDKAGQAAAVKIFPTLAAAGITHPDTVAGLAGKDPAEMLQAQGAGALREAFDARRPLAELVIDTLIAKTDLSNGWVESRWRAMSDVAPFIAALPRDQIIDQTLRAAEIIGWDTGNAIDMVARHIPETPASATLPAGDLGLPEMPRLSTNRHPDPTPDPGGPVSGGTAEHGTVLTRTDTAIDPDPVPAPEWEPIDVEPVDTVVDVEQPARVSPLEVTHDAVPDVVVEDVGVAADDVAVDVAIELGDVVAGIAVDVDVDEPAAAVFTERDAALAWLEVADPDAHAEYLQVQAAATDQQRLDAAEVLVQRYRTAAATEATVAGADVVDVATGPVAVPAVLQERPFEELPEQILAEEAEQLDAAAAAAQSRAAAAAARHTELIQQVANDQGPEMLLLRTQVEADRERLRAIVAAEKAVRQADAAEAATAAVGLQLMEAEQELMAVRGAFAGRRRVELQERIAELTVAHQQQEDKMMELEGRSRVLAQQTGTPRQQQQALALREAGYREKLAAQVAHARTEDALAVGHAKDWVATQQLRAEQAQQRLDQVRAEQAHRLAHPDPAAELRRQELYNEQQAELEEAGDEFVSSWERDLDGPAGPDTSFER